MRQVKRHAFFWILVALFTVFGGGKGAHWVVIATDRDGWRYEIDERSIFEVKPKLLRFRVRRENDAKRSQDIWLLDLDQNLLTLKSNGKPETINSGSIAFAALVYLKRTGRVPSGLKVTK